MLLQTEFVERKPQILRGAEQARSVGIINNRSTYRQDVILRCEYLGPDAMSQDLYREKFKKNWNFSVEMVLKFHLFILKEF